MIVKIYTLKNGLEVLEEVQAIRIKSKDYNLLILKDYVPIIGEIDGSFEIEINQDNIINYDNILAYYIMENNIFNILIKGE